MRIGPDLSRNWIESVQASVSRYPQQSGTVLSNVNREWNRVARESLCLLVELIQRLIACDPKHTIAIFEKSSNNNAVETLQIFWITNKDFKGVAVVPVQSISRSKPHKTSVVLNHGVHFCPR